MQGPQTDSSSPLSTLMLDRGGLQRMLDALRSRGYDVHGPTAVGTAIGLAPIESVDDLPRDWISQQEPGRYRLERSGNGEVFGYGPAVDSLKRYLNPPASTIWRATRENGDLKFQPAPEPPAPRAVIGVRPCDLHALARYDEVFTGGPFADPGYATRRAALFVVAANCTRPGGTCFCASMGTGPRASALFDVALTELPAADGEPTTAHRYLATAGSTNGASVLAALEAPAATAADLERERTVLEHAATHMGRTVEIQGLSAALAAAPEHARWEDVAHRCLSCANCTMVCPTCFCSTVEDHSTLAGTDVERRRRWDSCFTTEFSYIHGGSTRPSVRARYRQWATHKFQHWFEQFGSHGCVGCGRCITWCPVGIDLTVELMAVAGTGAQPR